MHRSKVSFFSSSSASILHRCLSVIIAGLVCAIGEAVCGVAGYRYSTTVSKRAEIPRS